MPESDTIVKQKLLIILKDDLKTIIQDIPQKDLADSVYYDIVLYKKYNEYRYTKKAVVEFYFLRNITARIVRKYRYHAQERKWDRYYNEYEFYDTQKKQ